MLEFLAGVCIASSHHVHAYCLLYVLRVFTCVSKTDICALQGKADFNTYVLFGTFIYVLLSAFTCVYVACFYLCFCDWHLCVAGKTGSGGVCTVWSHLVHTARCLYLYVLQVFTCVSVTDIYVLQARLVLEVCVLFGAIMYILLAAFTCTFYMLLPVFLWLTFVCCRQDWFWRCVYCLEPSCTYCLPWRRFTTRGSASSSPLWYGTCCNLVTFHFLATLICTYMYSGGQLTQTLQITLNVG